MGWHLKSFWQAIAACLRLGIPVMVRGDSQLNTHRSAWLRTAKQLMYPPALHLFSAALFVGERSKAYFRRYGVPEHRLFFAPHGIDEVWFQSRATYEARQTLRSRLGVDDRECLLLFAGKLVEFKRPLDVVQAAAVLRKVGAPVSVAVAGEGLLASAMRVAASEAQAPLHLLGFLNQSDMPRAYAAADVLVLPSDGRETWGLVANEAIACGTPIVVSDEVGCAPDLVGDGLVGRSFRMGDVASLARSVQAILAAPPSGAAMRAKLDHFGLVCSAEGILAAAEYSVRRRSSSSRARSALSPPISTA
jgi:glycosyltransferase involved in cell wall biosynthesis